MFIYLINEILRKLDGRAGKLIAFLSISAGSNLVVSLFWPRWHAVWFAMERTLPLLSTIYHYGAYIGSKPISHRKPTRCSSIIGSEQLARVTHTGPRRPMSTASMPTGTRTHRHPCPCQHPPDTTAGYPDQRLLMLGLTCIPSVGGKGGPGLRFPRLVKVK